MKYLFALLLALSFSASANIPASAIRTNDLDSICNTKTGTIRNVSEKTKRYIFRRDGVPGGNHTGICAGPSGCECDHIVSLELGGSNDASNLKIQPYDGLCNARHKDHLENMLHSMICGNKISVDQAQYEIYTDWITAYKKYVDPAGCGL